MQQQGLEAGGIAITQSVPLSASGITAGTGAAHPVANLSPRLQALKDPCPRTGVWSASLAWAWPPVYRRETEAGQASQFQSGSSSMGSGFAPAPSLGHSEERWEGAWDQPGTLKWLVSLFSSSADLSWPWGLLLSL